MTVLVVVALLSELLYVYIVVGLASTSPVRFCTLRSVSFRETSHEYESRMRMVLDIPYLVYCKLMQTPMNASNCVTNQAQNSVAGLELPECMPGVES